MAGLALAESTARPHANRAVAGVPLAAAAGGLQVQPAPLFVGPAVRRATVLELVLHRLASRVVLQPLIGHTAWSGVVDHRRRRDDHLFLVDDLLLDVLGPEEEDDADPNDRKVNDDRRHKRQHFLHPWLFQEAALGPTRGDGIASWAISSAGGIGVGAETG